jgi:histidine triad (HIT) family protein
MGDCLFCRIVAKEIPATVVHETANTLAFRDINPQAPVHVLVIPKEHVGSLLDVEARHQELLLEIHQAIQAVARKEKVEEKGFRVAVNTGPDSGQAVGHLHYHVLGGRSLTWPPG